MFSEKWMRRGLDMAELVASWSRDPSTQCGAVVMRPDKTIASVGYNGFPRGCSDADDLYQDRELKYARVIHAEQNAILNAKESLEGYTMFTYPGGIGPSCDRCSAHIIQAGITEIVHYYEPSTDGFANRWEESVKRGLDMYREAGVKVVQIPKSEKEIDVQRIMVDSYKKPEPRVEFLAGVRWEGSE